MKRRITRRRLSRAARHLLAVALPLSSIFVVGQPSHDEPAFAALTACEPVDENTTCAPDEENPVEDAGPGTLVTRPDADLSWLYVYLKAEPGEGVHGNLQQAAKNADLNYDVWNPLTKIDVPLQGETIYLCGPNPTLMVSLIEYVPNGNQTFFHGQLEGVPTCI